MSTNSKYSFSLLLLLLFLLISVQDSKARLLKTATAADADADHHLSLIQTVVDKLYIEAIKNGGPSNGGKGHKFVNAQPVQRIMNSGPSPGEGN